MENIEIPRVRKRDLIPFIGLISYSRQASNLQDKVGKEEYQENIRPSVRLRTATLLVYNVAWAVYLPAVTKGIESLFN